MDAIPGPIRNSGPKNEKNTSMQITEPTSLSTLIVWNVTKALEKSPTLNVKEAIVSAQSRLEQFSDAGNLQTILSSPYDRHLACAMLAWQQLGHSDADSLCRFVEDKTKIEEIPSKLSSSHEAFDIESLSRTSKESKISRQTVTPDIVSTSQDSRESKYKEAMCFSSFNSFSMGPVVKLPVESKVVMRLENTSRGRSSGQPKRRPPEKDIISRIDQACCMDSVCAERLAAMDATTTELRSRAGTLARREAERAELLERAEAAWKDLELGYRRRLTLAEEKEEDISKQITKLLEERISYKEAYSVLAQELKGRGSKAETERTRLSELEKKVCDRACLRMRVSEESAKLDALVAEQACRSAQLDRDLQFKEEQVRRNMLNRQNEVAALRAMTCETERATRSELSALRDQIAAVSAKLLEEHDRSEQTKAELEDSRQEKMDLINDLDGCKLVCDERMQGRMDELNKKRDQLNKLRDKAMDCRCKLPISVAVEVKRTPSLAALCKCTPEDKILESCSCTSMSSKLLSNLFSDLFSGLHAELGGAILDMPCQLLKCLEDKHNWDRASVVKSNLTDYFSKLLVGELDIAIATAIENYHAKWVGMSCADNIKMTPGPDDDTEREGWQKRAIERRAQKLATQLAEQLFQERADELTQRARDIVEAGPPPCECDTKAKLPAGCSCGKSSPSSKQPGETEPVVYWQQAMQDHTQLNYRLQTEDKNHKKSSFKKDSLKTVEDRFDKFPQQNSVTGPHAHKKVNSADCKRNKESLNIANKGRVDCSCLVKKIEDKIAPAPVTPLYWQQAIEDVTLLRVQIEDLKKESIKKDDLKMMENKITKIIQRASEGPSFANPKNKFATEGNKATETSKYSKVNRAMNHTELRLADIDKPTTKKKLNGPISKEIKTKPILNRGTNMFYKRNNPAYTVNMCLCRTKRQEQNEITEKCQHETSGWKEKKSKDTVSKVSSSVRQYRPITNSFLSQDISARSYNEANNEVLCPSSCACFHKMPSNTSIDQLLDTLSKWKGDLDTSFTEKNFVKNSCCSYGKVKQASQSIFPFKTSLKSKVKSQEIPLQKGQKIVDNQGSTHKIIVEQPNTKKLGKNSAKSADPVATTDSVYMGAVNLDKSHEEVCECNQEGKTNNETPFNCISSSKCTCENTLNKPEENEIQMMFVKQQSGVIQTKERRVKDILVLPNTPNTLQYKEPNKSQSPKKEISNNITDKNIEERTLRTSDYKINFLGVTLVDVNPKMNNNQTLLENDNKKITASIAAPYEKHHSDNRKTSKKIKHYDQDYSGANIDCRVSVRTDYENRIDKKNRSILINSADENEYPNYLIHSNMNQKKMQKSHYANEHNNVSINNQTMFLSDMNKLDVSQLHKNIKYKSSEIDYKTASEQNTSHMDCDTDQRQKIYGKVNPNTRNSQESDISKKSYETASESNQLFDKAITKGNSRDKEFKEIIRKKQSSSSNKNLKTAQILSCQCSIKLEEFKKFIEENFTKNTATENVGLDVQSLRYIKERGESCVCCSKLNNDNCKDLEDNAFHLLEEYLKKKLSEFRVSACSSYCISAEEEDKIFEIIVKRVKRLISESTNQISCKCSTGERKSQGSWNRAYGLLQEYLNIKIKKVQCSCLLAEDNKDTILPDVLEKISNLIEYDFQRLRNVCNCINAPNTQENRNNYGKQVNFEAEVPEKDQSVMFQTDFSKFSALDDQISLRAYQDTQSNYLKQDESQNPLTLAMEDGSYNLLETNEQNLNVADSIHRSHKLAYENSTGPERNIAVSINNTNTIDEISIESTNGHIKTGSLANTSAEKNQLHSINAEQSTVCSLCNSTRHQRSVTISNHCFQNCKEIWQKQHENVKSNFQEVPYLGYTIACSCDKTLGPCICPKNATNTDPEMISNMWRKSIPDEAFFDKVSYIFPKQQKLKENIVNQSLNTQMSNDIDLQSVFEKKSTKNLQMSEATCCTELEPMVLKTPTYNTLQSNVETNTFQDNVSEVTDCSNTEDVDWCECDPHMDRSKNLESSRLKRSIYFPAPVEGIDERLKDDIFEGSTSGNVREHVCVCEKVPLCHVKMLVENIENKLANAYCTCDTLTLKVCPVHSKMC